MRDVVTTALEVAGFACLVAAAWFGFGLVACLAVAGLVLLALGYLFGRTE